MASDDFYPNGWPKEHVPFDGGDPGVFSGLLDPLVAAICRIKGCAPAHLSGRDRAKAERIVADGLSQDRFIQIIEDTILSGEKWNVAVFHAWEEVKQRGQAAAKSAGTSVFIKATDYDAERQKAWFAKEPSERARITVDRLREIVRTGNLPKGVSLCDIKRDLARAERELAMWSEAK